MKKLMSVLMAAICITTMTVIPVSAAESTENVAGLTRNDVQQLSASEKQRIIEEDKQELNNILSQPQNLKIGKTSFSHMSENGIKYDITIEYGCDSPRPRNSGNYELDVWVGNGWWANFEVNSDISGYCKTTTNFSVLTANDRPITISHRTPELIVFPPRLMALQGKDIRSNTYGEEYIETKGYYTLSEGVSGLNYTFYPEHSVSIDSSNDFNTLICWWRLG